MKIIPMLMTCAISAISIFAGPVSFYGELKVSNGKLVGSKTGTNYVQLRGVSFGWSNTGWESADFFNANAVNRIADDWKAEIVRAPLGYSEYGGYQSDASNLSRVKAVIDAAIAKDIYVIIDWHSHKASSEKDAAKTFFTSMAQTYGKNDHVIFEVYNEPLAESWSNIKSYATEVITEIRKYSDNLVIVGTGNWSQNIHEPADNKISDANTAYVAHFYAASHHVGESPDPSVSTLTFRQRILNSISKGCAVLVSEYGTTTADGGQGGNFNSHSATYSDGWLYFLNQNSITSLAWNVNDKNEGSAFFTTNFDQSNSSNWTNTGKMNESGKYIFNMLKEWAKVAPWRPGNGFSSSSVSSSSISSSSSIPVVVSPLIDDLEDGDPYTIWGGKWYTYNDNANGGASVVTPLTSDANVLVPVATTNGSLKMAQINYTLNKGSLASNPYVGLGFDLRDNGTTWDLNSCVSIIYRYRGAAHRFRLELTETMGSKDHYGQTTAASADWKNHFISMSYISQEGLGAPVNLNLTNALRFSFQVQDAFGSGYLEIDDIKCNGAVAPPKTSLFHNYFQVKSSINWNAKQKSILFNVPQHRTGKLSVLNILGKKQVIQLNEAFSSGNHQVSLHELKQGRYIVKLQYGNFMESQIITVK